MSRILGRRIAATAFVAALGVAALSGCATPSGSEVIDPVGTWGDPEEAGSPSLTLDEGGALSGTDGCNRLSGTWEVQDEDLITFGSVATTRMACPDVDTWLEGLSQASISGTTMTILGSDGAEIGQLERAEESSY